MDTNTMRIYWALLFFPSVLLADGPHYQQKDTFVQQEFDNVYFDLRNVRNQITTANSKTLAQIRALTPGAVGQIYYCSNCTTEAICVSTGTAVAQFSGSSGRANACQ